MLAQSERECSKPVSFGTAAGNTRDRQDNQYEPENLENEDGTCSVDAFQHMIPTGAKRCEECGWP